MKTIYEVVINNEHSRYFETLRAARNWAKWWAKKGENNIVIWKGGAGGIRVS